MQAIAEKNLNISKSVGKTFEPSVAKTISPSGVFSASEGRQLQMDVYKVTASGVKLILVDFQAITFMNSCGLGGLIAAFKQVRSLGGGLYICGLNPQVRMLFELTGIDQVFQIFADSKDFQQTVLEKVV
jgi:anti-anti-sigma factor